MSARIGDDEPGVGLVVIRGDEALVEVYGLARVEPSRAVDLHTRFRLASVSKMMTAVGVLVLVDAGSIALDDLVIQHVPVFPYPDITIAHLLGHTSGLPEYAVLEEELLARGHRPTHRDVLEVLAEQWPELMFEPGSRFEYSNVGYDVLPSVVESVTGVPFALHMKDAVFEPLGMHDAFVIEPEQRAFENIALGYAVFEDGVALDNDHPFNMIVGAGGVFASVLDMAVWHQVLEPGRVLEAATLEVMLTPGISGDYGLGWALDEGGAGHTGSWVGFNTSFWHDEEEAITVVVLCNANRDPDAIADAVMSRLSGR